MNMMKEFLVTNKKVVSIITGCILVVLGITMYMLLQQKSITLKMEVFTVEINEDLDKNAETYLENVTNDNATVDFATVDIANLGEYDGTIKVNDVDYKIAFKVVDTRAPTFKALQTKFSFSLEDTVETVNETINESLEIEDNSKEEFKPLTIIEEIPDSEKEVDVKVSVKDTSDNESEIVNITIQFTEDGEEKEGLQKEEKQAESKGTVTNKKPQQSNSSTSSNTPTDTPNTDTPSNDGSSNSNSSSNESSNGNTSSNGGNSSSNGGNTSTEKPKPTPTPTPTPEPEPEPTPEPTPKPDPKPDYVCPTGVIDKMKPCDWHEEFIPIPGAIEWKLFKSDAEINAYYRNLDYEKYGIMRGSVRVNDGSFLYSAEIIEQ